MKILFILKNREGYGHEYGHVYSNCNFSSGLLWSVKFLVDMLKGEGVNAKLVQVTDNNDIDQKVSLFRPDVVIIEALWVVPNKFDILKKLHPNVEWIVRLHSNLPFLASEGVAIEWIRGYQERGITVASNSNRLAKDFNLLYLPNFYPLSRCYSIKQKDDVIDISCHGAIRPLKNQLSQAVAAIQFAQEEGKLLRFHINGTRVENGDSVLKNLRSLFFNTPNSLIEEPWMTHEVFLCVLASMDIGMQVSLSETFSIVAADMTAVGIPMVVSPEVRWASGFSKVDPNDVQDIVAGLRTAYYYPRVNSFLNRRNLRKAGEKARRVWADFICGE